MTMVLVLNGIKETAVAIACVGVVKAESAIMVGCGKHQGHYVGKPGIELAVLLKYLVHIGIGFKTQYCSACPGTKRHGNRGIAGMRANINHHSTGLDVLFVKVNHVIGKIPWPVVGMLPFGILHLSKILQVKMPDFPSVLMERLL